MARVVPIAVSTRLDALAGPFKGDSRATVRLKKEANL
jgi:hypothetical protein